MTDEIYFSGGAKYLRDKRKRNLGLLSEPLKEAEPIEKLHVDLGLRDSNVIEDSRFGGKPDDKPAEAGEQGSRSADVVLLPTMRNRVVKSTAGG